MANIKSQIKRIRPTRRRVSATSRCKSALKTAVRRVRTAADVRGRRGRDRRAPGRQPRQLDKAASKGVIHKNQAANRKSGLAKQVAGL